MLDTIRAASSFTSRLSVKVRAARASSSAARRRISLSSYCRVRSTTSAWSESLSVSARRRADSSAALKRPMRVASKMNVTRRMRSPAPAIRKENCGGKK